MASPVASPCTKVCTLNEAGDACTGCFRTLDEIRRWSTMSEGERARVVARVRAAAVR